MKYNKELHEALLLIVDYNIDYLSHKGKERWRELLKQFIAKEYKKEER